MCCDDSEEEHLPPVVRTMIEHYRALHAERGLDWGDEYEPSVRVLYQFASWCDIDQLAEALFLEIDAPGTLVDPVEAVLKCVVDPLPGGLAIVRPDGIELPSPLPSVIPGRPVTYQLLVAPDGAPGRALEAHVEAEDPHLRIDGHCVQAAVPTQAGRVRLVSDAVSRWTVTDERGGGWFPEQDLRKYDADNVPYFHGNNVVVDVPAGRLTITAARGCEFRPTETSVDVEASQEIVIELSPERLYDAASRGWYGGDLHVHLNWSGDQVCTPHDAALMQQGEGLHLMNLLAANGFTATIYDQEAFEHYAGQDLPWTTPDRVARWGVEYRNDMMGHFTALNPSGPPRRYQTGHQRSNEPQDWPPNATAAEEFRDLGATIGYTHPIMAAIDADGDPGEVFAHHRSRSTEARELVADAALGLVDSVDLGGPCHLAATEYVYHRLLGCGLRLAVTAGTDAMLSHSRSSLRSNPPGWCRAYAHLGNAPLTVAAWQDAVRAGRTFTTNGPWLELNVAEHGIGDTVALTGPDTVSVTTRVRGLGVRTLDVVGPNGLLARLDLTEDQEHAELTTALVVTEPTWLVAIARGGHQRDFGSLDHPYAHTSPVWIDITNRSVKRSEDAAWCLDWLDRFESLARAKGHFTHEHQLDDLRHVLDKARSFYRGIGPGA